MTYKPTPTETKGGKDVVPTSDIDIQSLLQSIDKELKILNLHMSVVTDNVFTKEDVE